MAAPRNDSWHWFTDKVLPSLFVLLASAVCAVLWANYNAVQMLASKQELQSRDIEQLRSEMVAIKAGYMTRMEVLETVKRIEQQLEIQMLRAGMRPQKERQ